MPLLTCTDLAPGYDGHALVKDLSFEVNAGDYLCIVGENGAGKSTLMRTLLGLQPPLSGSIEFGDGLRRRDLGWLPQQTPVQRDFPAAVGEVVLSGCQSREGFRPFYTKRDRDRAKDAMLRMDIRALEKRCYRELSGGQQQRVLLARALCAADKLLLLDEPVAGLDPMATQELYSLIGELNRGGMTILMISHDMNAALRYASHILHIGGASFFGTRQDYLRAGGARRYLQRRGGHTT
jgi:zinc transport system ATP-binding protein